jgi:DNA-binding response OmpR family regulator
MRLLLVEDDPQLGDGLAVGLRQRGYVVDWVRDGVAADLALQNDDYAVLVLDLGLPRLAGMEVLKRLRQRGQQIPALLLTARDATDDKIEGLDSGADDYLVKPVPLDELAARVRALVRRASGRSAPTLQHGELTLDPAARSLTRDGASVNVSAMEFSLLQTLLENRGRVLTRAQLESAIYGWDEEPGSNALEVHIHNLRRKLGSELIKTLRGVGYTVPRL